MCCECPRTWEKRWRKTIVGRKAKWVEIPNPDATAGIGVGVDESIFAPAREAIL
jgi:hypothetical protein